LTLFPLWLVSRFKIKGLSASVGQLMLFRRSALEKIGGYDAIKGSVIDDFQLGRNILKHRLSWSLMDATNEVNCQMYRNLREAINGFSKNFLPVFNFNIPLFVFIFLYLLLVYLEPLIIFFIKATTNHLPFLPWLPILLCVPLSILQHGLVFWRIKTPCHFALMYPFGVLVASYTALRSLIAYRNHSVEWKGRPIT
jgi:chlorobactene glucosyltransferase